MNSDNSVAIIFGVAVAVGILLWAVSGDESEEKTPQQKEEEEEETKKVQKLVKEEYYEEAVSRSCKLLFGLIRRKSAVKDKDGMSLIDHVFRPEKPILKFTRHAEHLHLDVHGGYYFLLKGVAAAFRNPASHAMELRMTETEASIQISLIGYLYHLIKHYTEPTQAKS